VRVVGNRGFNLMLGGREGGGGGEGEGLIGVERRSAAVGWRAHCR
jgi:hypothetical protein